MTITGTDDAGVEWEGEIDLDLDDDGSSIAGTISWTSSADYHGVETVEGEMDERGNITLRGVSVTEGGIVPCEYEGTWIDGHIDVHWVGNCPSGDASGDDDGSGERENEADEDDNDEPDDSDSEA